MDHLLPSIDRCILHLRLLAAFARLRDSIRSNDGLFGCYDQDATSQADLRWTIFVAKAVARFEKWHDALLEKNVVADTAWRLPGFDTDGSAAASLLDSRPSGAEWIEPPLDVLMVFHSYMLNPRAFLEDHLRRAGFLLSFPWDAFEENLDPETLSYGSKHDAIKTFEEATGESWDVPRGNLVNIQCPSCSTSVPVSGADLYAGKHDQSEKGNVHMSLQLHCPTCEQTITQELLTLARLRKDLSALKSRGIPLPGTILTKDRLAPSKYGSVPPGTFTQIHALNTLLDHDSMNQPSTHDSAVMLDRFWKDIEQKIAASDQERQPLMTIALNRMKARYHNNHSPYALDLVGAVLRQGTFITKMQDYDWIQSPGLQHTVAQAIERYKGFFAVIAAHPKNVAVPTFDVDLVWHTHQLSPSDYYDYSVNICNALFIDHDDKLGDGVLVDSFGWTCLAFEDITGKRYDKCLCWTCELLEQATMRPSTAAAEQSGSLTSRIKNKMKRSAKKQQLSPTEIEVIRTQLRKFEKDYASRNATSIDTGKVPVSKLDFYQTYKWHHPAYAPLSQELLP